MKTIAILNEKGGTAKTTTSVNLAAALGETGKKVLLVDLDGQAASSRWLGVEGDTRLADALLRGGGLVPIDNVLPGVSLAPASGKLDSISHNLRPTQGSQLRRVLAEVKDRYDYILIDCPPSLGNRLIGNALLAASHAIVPVETSILALDGLRILLTMLDDIRQGFEHDIELIGALGCRFNSRTRLSRLVLAELHRALPGKVFGTVIHETVRMQECPAAEKSILEYAPDCSAAKDYRALAGELVHGITPCTVDIGCADLAEDQDVDQTDRQRVSEFRKRAGEIFHRPACKAHPADEPVDPEDTPVTEEPQLEQSADSPVADPPQDEHPDQPETQHGPRIPVRSISITLTPNQPGQDETETADEDVAAEPVVPQEPVESAPVDEYEQDRETDTLPEPRESIRTRDNAIIGAAAIVLLGIMSICGWAGFKALTPGPQAASAGDALPAETMDRNRSIPPLTTHENATPPKPDRMDTPAVDAANEEESSGDPRPDNTVQPKPETDRAVIMPAPAGGNQVDSPKVAADKPETLRQNEQKPTDAPMKESTPAAPDKPAENTVAKGKSESNAPTTQPSSEAPTTQPSPRLAKAEDYPVGLTLTAVMYSKRSRRAIISGTVVYEGEKVKGVKIVKILPDSVEIEANGFRFLLGTGPKPVWLKATQVLPPNNKKGRSVSTETDSHE
ncbi:MAG: AAA family ATPase [Phycisphaerae bacterium]|jgi:chromosome partitioning protein|nr:AAA family ATPase [Phycisphaerae bacterium]